MSNSSEEINEYWKERAIRSQQNITDKSIEETEAQLKKYYRRAMEKCIDDFGSTFDRLLLDVENGREHTPADLYKLDKYWTTQNRLKAELQRLGDKQAALLSKNFMDQYINVYNNLALKDGLYFGSISKETALQMINQIWCADGLSWSQRIWTNTDRLQEVLNENLIHCVVTGKRTRDLKLLLQETFNVSYRQADTLVRTELAHIQTQAALKRYEDFGAEYVEIFAEEDERLCEVCGKLHGTRYPVGAAVPIPAHPRCRCCLLPVVD